MNKLTIIIILFFNITLIAQEDSTMNKKVNKTDSEWKEILTQQQYYVLREKGTDRAGDHGYTKHFEKGTYHCAACDAQLFESGTKYESHCGWPSFDDAIKGTVKYKKDMKFGMLRTEIICAACNGGGSFGPAAIPGPDEPPFGPTFSELQSNVFTPTCAASGCHIGIGAPHGLRLDPLSSYGLLVNFPSAQSTGTLRVAPGNPGASYLIQKLEGTSTFGSIRSS